MKKILVIGAGYAGILTAKKLGKKFKKNSDVEVSIIDKNSFSTMLTELHEVAAGRVDEESIKMELSDVFAHRNINVIVDEVTKIDTDATKVITKNAEYDYDYLVVATGSKPTFFNTKGHEYAFELWSYQDAVDLKIQIEQCFRDAARETDAKRRQELLTFSVIGCGFTGVEMASELGEYKDELCRKFNVDVKEVIINNIDVCERILPIYPEKLQAKVEKKYKKLGINIMTGHPVSEIGKDFIVVNEEKIPCATTIWAAGIEGSDLIANSPEFEQEGRGRFKTNQYLQATNYENIYVAGDNIFYVPEGSKGPVPQMVENAELSAKCVSVNVYAAINGGQLTEYKPKFNGSMVSVGSRWGVACIGADPAKGRQFSGFLAMFIKHMINFVYFIDVLGLHKWYSYAKHEFFTTKNKRSFVGGHFSNDTAAPTFFLVPLRIFLGIMWLMSGIAKLPDILADWTNVTSFPNRATRNAELAAQSGETASTAAAAGATGTTGGGEQATDAAAGATGATTGGDAATTGGDAATSATSTTGGATEGSDTALSGFDSFAHWAGESFELKTAGGGAVPRPGFVENIMDWMYATFFWKGETDFTILAAIFQSGVVFAELGIGILFILGLFTPLAAIISFVLMLMIYMSGWAYMSIFFYGLAGLACIFAGNVLGLDYYVLPWLDKKLRTWRFTKKWYLYFK